MKIFEKYENSLKITICFPAAVLDYTSNFENKLRHFLDMKDRLSREELIKLGLKDQDTELEKFVLANTQELGKDKWLCPLSGKKFKGPDFVRKHIFNKHAEKVEEQKKEVRNLFFISLSSIFRFFSIYPHPTVSPYLSPF